MRNPAFFLIALLALTCASQAGDVITYETQIKPLLREHCFKCHGDDEQKSSLNMQNYPSLLKGGSGGVIVVPGRPSKSVMYQAVAHEGDAEPMPPKRAKLADADIALIKAWIEQGARENSGSESKVAERRNLEFKAESVAQSSGPPPMPVSITDAKLPEPKRPQPVTALAASPRAPLLAVAGVMRVNLINLENRQTIGALPFPEGTPYVIRFSRDGRVLLVAGGRPVQSGKVVLFDVKTGQRLAVIGDELDAVLAADISPDQQTVALGGSGKIVKIYSTRDGHLLHRLTRHTDWITAIEYSPDGARLATADRNGAIHLWDPQSGGILLSLSEHKEAVWSMSWRPDSQVLASASEDGQLIFWDTQDGWPASTVSGPHTPKSAVKSYGKPLNGILCVSYAPSGRLITCGRDRVVRLWNASTPLRAFEPLAALPSRAVLSYDGRLAISGDAVGALHYWETAK